MRDDVLSGGSYLSSNDMRVHFGLGDADRDAVEIHWPCGARETIKLPAVDRIYTIVEGQGITGSFCIGPAPLPSLQMPTSLPGVLIPSRKKIPARQRQLRGVKWLIE